MVSTRSMAAQRPTVDHGDDDCVGSSSGLADQSARSLRAGVPPTRSVPAYEYTPLSEDQVRLLTLLPAANPSSPLLIRIQHARLPPRPPRRRFLSRDELRDINARLPRGWECLETLSGRLIYVSSEQDVSSWTAPGSTSASPRDPDPRSRENQNDDDDDEEEDAAPPYEALSYTWGSPKSRKAVFVDTPGSPLAKLRVTKNLAAALSQLRGDGNGDGPPRTFWIDAICIDQGRVAERSAQVPRMSLIYQRAARVVVWLGRGSARSRLALRALRRLGGQVEISRSLSVMRAPGAEEPGWYGEGCDLPLEPRAWGAVAALVQRLWFTRVWVVQEIHLANSSAVVRCGGDEDEDTIQWQVFRRAIMCLSVKRNLPPGFRADITAVGGSVHYERSEPWSGLALTVVQRECSDARDRVYGLLGLMADGLRARIQPDYDLSVDEVYRQTLLAEIAHFGRLDGLRMCGYRPGGSGITGPSWVPDLIRVVHYVETMRYQFSAGMSCCEAGCLSPDLLEVLGTEVGKVGDVLDKLSLEEADDLETAMQWMVEYESSTPSSLDGALWDTLPVIFCGMRTRDRFPDIPKLPKLEEWVCFLQGSVASGAYTLDDNATVTAFYLEFVRSLLFQRTLFFGEGGHVGLGPLDMRKGDTIAVLLGYDAPMLLREVGDSTYQIIGELMVPTLRDGTGLLGPLPEPWTCQIYMDSVGVSSSYRFLNRESGATTQDDPRLPPLVGWQSMNSIRTADDLEVYQKFKNVETGDVINYDPRMSPDALRKIGVVLKGFVLL